jgi:acetyl-CoA acetyltransferase
VQLLGGYGYVNDYPDALRRVGSIDLAGLDLIEINEAFTWVSLAPMRDLACHQTGPTSTAVLLPSAILSA